MRTNTTDYKGWLDLVHSVFHPYVRRLNQVAILSLAVPLLAMGTALRFSNLSNQELLFFDTAQIAYNPLILLEQHYFLYSTARHAYIALVAFVYLLFGGNLAIPSYLSAMFGTLAVVLVGFITWICKRSWSIVILAMGLMAGAYFPIWWSRTGMPYNWAMCMAVVSLIFLYRSERDQNPRFLWWGGIILGYAFANHYSILFIVTGYFVWEVVRQIEAPPFQYRPLIKRLAAFAAFFAVVPVFCDISIRLLRFFSGYDGKVEASGILMYILKLFFSNADAEVNQSYIREVAGSFLANSHLQGTTAGFSYYLHVLWYFEGVVFAILAVLSLIYLWFLWRRYQNKTARFVFLFTVTPLIVFSIIAGTGGLAVPRLLVVVYPTLVISIAWVLVDMVSFFVYRVFGSNEQKLARRAIAVMIILLVVGFSIYSWINTYSLRTVKTYYSAVQSYVQGQPGIKYVGGFGNLILWRLLLGDQFRSLNTDDEFNSFIQLPGKKALLLHYQYDGRLSWISELNEVSYRSFPSLVERSEIVATEEGFGTVATQDQANRLWGEIRVYILH